MPETLLPPALDKSEERIRRMFGEISPRYDFLNHFLSGGTDWYWRWRAVRAAPPRGTAPILDVCTGTGDLALAYWKKSGGKTPVVGADFTREMLVIADKKAAKPRAAVTEGTAIPTHRKDAEGIPSPSPLRGGGSGWGASVDGPSHPHPDLPPSKGKELISSGELCHEKGGVPLVFLQADTQRLPFADAQFQIVCVAFGLRNVTDTRRGLAEMIRVCQPGGNVVVLEFSLPSNRLLRGLYTWYFRNVLPRIGQLLARNSQSAYNYLPTSVSGFPYGAELAALMKECGLATVTFTPLTFGIATLYIGRK